MYCVFPHLYKGFPAYSPYMYMYIYWPLASWEYKLLFLTWYQSYRFSHVQLVLSPIQSLWPLLPFSYRLWGPPGSGLDKSRPSSDISLTESSRAYSERIGNTTVTLRPKKVIWQALKRARSKLQAEVTYLSIINQRKRSYAIRHSKTKWPKRPGA
jgi:hypothetical protein